ncbi:hypothetical protein [Chitinibacter sp. S2-10]|uniref:hypothetical protein n=1 Tax=Chitinibacter sp. S2-10 TaxID=3373597 RepID=UPI00397756F4
MATHVKRQQTLGVTWNLYRRKEFMELLIVAILFYLTGRNSELLGGKNQSRFKFLANFAAALLFVLFFLALVKYGPSDLMEKALGSSRFYQLSGMLLIWGGYMLRVRSMAETKTGSPYNDIFYAYKNFPYKNNIFLSAKIIACDAVGLILFLTWILK